MAQPGLTDHSVAAWTAVCHSTFLSLDSSSVPWRMGTDDCHSPGRAVMSVRDNIRDDLSWLYRFQSSIASVTTHFLMSSRTKESVTHIC